MNHDFLNYWLGCSYNAKMSKAENKVAHNLRIQKTKLTFFFSERKVIDADGTIIKGVGRE